MRERPIVFNTEMVRSILDGRKTCTRRVIKFPNGMTGHPIGKAGDSSNPLGVMYPGGIKRPPYQPGDILYVRETFTWCPCWDCGLDTTPDGCKNPVISTVPFRPLWANSRQVTFPVIRWSIIMNLPE